MLLKAAQTHLGDEVGGALFLQGLGHAPLAQAEADVLLDGEPGEQRVALEHHAPVGARAFHRHAIQQHAAAGGVVQPRHDAQQRGFAAARGAEDGDKVVVTHFKINGQQGMCALAFAPFKGARDGLNRYAAHRTKLQANRRWLSALKAKSDTSPMRPMMMMPKMIWPVLSSDWLSVIMWPMPLDEPISSATIT